MVSAEVDDWLCVWLEPQVTVTFVEELSEVCKPSVVEVGCPDRNQFERRLADSAVMMEPSLTDVECFCKYALCSCMSKKHNCLFTALFLIQVDDADAAHFFWSVCDRIWKADGMSDLVE